MPCAKAYTENKNKIIAYLQFGDWYHLNTRWLTQMKKFIMSYISMTIYNISSFYLLLSILSASYFVSLYCIFVLDKKSREINRKNWWFMYNPIVAALPIWRFTKKTRLFLLLKYAITQQKFIIYQQIMFSFHRSYFENWFRLDVYWNWLSDIICISFTNKDVVYFCLQNVERTNQIIINFILALSHVW